jgi:serine/threonine protein kinase
MAFFMTQIMRGLKFIHSANVLHRDLKPSNVLIDLNCDLKICDFGLARVAHPSMDHAGILTEYVATRWYRAPEIMLNAKAYTQAIDIWAAGCILAEMLTHRALFPGSDYYQQLHLIFRFIGTPHPDELAFIRSDAARKYVARMPAAPRASFAQAFPSASIECLDFLERIFQFNPDSRMTAEESLIHPFLLGYHDESQEPSSSDPLGLDFENDDLPIPMIKQLLLQEALQFQYPQVQQGVDATSEAAMQ